MDLLKDRFNSSTSTMRSSLSMIGKSLLFLPLVTVFIATTSFAQRAILDVRGCGTGCRVETMQLSKPSKMSDGWAKVLVSESWIEQDLDGVDHINGRFGGQYWFFANCNEGLVGSGSRSDRLDATVTSIYTVDGLRKNVTASGNLYERWRKLCDATGN